MFLRFNRISCNIGSVYPEGWTLPLKTKSQAAEKAIDFSKFTIENLGTISDGFSKTGTIINSLEGSAKIYTFKSPSDKQVTNLDINVNNNV